MGLGFNVRLPAAVVDAMAESARLKQKLLSCPEKEKPAVRAGIQDQLLILQAFYLESLQSVNLEIRALHDPAQRDR